MHPTSAEQVLHVPVPGQPGTTSAERAYALATGRRYFGEALPLMVTWPFTYSDAPPKRVLEKVELPDWAADLGVGTPAALLVDAATVAAGGGPAFMRCDWPRAVFLYLDGWLERSQEAASGPIHSYALRLPTEWGPAYDHAWVNRIFLFLRRWIAREMNRDEAALFGPVPAARFVLTHDVDALEKTIPLRLKSTAMSTIAVLRHLAGGNFSKAGQRGVSALQYATTRSSFWLFDEICQAEDRRGFRSIFMFADRPRGSGVASWLMDPGYRASEPRVAALMHRLTAGGWQIGMHPGFNTWRDPQALERTRQDVGAAAGSEIGICRQHWLRFSWADTWKAQIASGIRLDFTLGFNDRPGLRTGAALRYHPWDQVAGHPLNIEIMPTLLMDSHFYDYSFPADPAAAMSPWIDEVIAVGGEASLLWHTQTMHADYGWGDGYHALLDLLVACGAHVCGTQVDDVAAAG